MRECVLLIHGLAESEMKLWPLSLWLSHRGFRPVSITYPSQFYPAERLLAEYIAPVLQDLAHEPVLHVVTHSLGGVLLSAYLQSQALPNLGRVVMLTPAHQGSELFEFYRRFPLPNLIFGPVLQQSGVVPPHCFPCTVKDPVHYELGIVSGCLPLHPISPFIVPWPHDGRISVRRTLLRGMQDHLLLPASHEWIAYHPMTLYQTEHFLQHGRFDHRVAVGVAQAANSRAS